MKKALIILLLIPVFSYTQITEELDFISPIQEGVFAVKNGELWGFINNHGDLVIDYRGDLVLTNVGDKNYPVFKNNRCLISEIKAGFTYFGYIDKTGKTVIAPQFLNATNFNNDYAVAIELVMEKLGRNEVLGKNVIFHKYFEVLIDPDGNVKQYLNPEGINVVLDKKYLAKPPKITSKQLSNKLYSVLNINKKWSVVRVSD